MIFSYDESGAPIAIHYRLNGSAENVFYTYYLEKNLQGDIIAVYNASGTKLVGYTYDAWGNCTTTYYNGGGSTGAQYNPFRYRGYYYDTGLELYYLNSRYYDSRTGRFINADGQLNGGLLGYNLFAYCDNNPVRYVDRTGYDYDCFDAFGEDDHNPLNDYDEMVGGGSAYHNYQVRSNVARADASLGGYYYGGGATTNLDYYYVPGAVTVTDNMVTDNKPGKGYKTFKEFKAENGKAGKNKHWHHIVEQCQIEKSGFSPYSIHNTNNLVPVDSSTHSKITGYYNSKPDFTNSQTVRDWLTGKSFEFQYKFGWDVYQKFGGG